MNKAELYTLRGQLSVLREITKEYSGKTIDNVVTNLEARISHAEKASQ